MTTKTMAELKKTFSETVNRVRYGGDRVLVTSRGKSAVAIISAEDLAYYERLEELVDLKEAEAALADIAKNKGATMPLSEFKKQLAKKKG